MRKQLSLYIISLWFISQICGQNPFLPTNSQVMEWNDPSYYQISNAPSRLGIWYQSQYGRAQLDLFNSYALYGHHTFSVNQKDSWGIQLIAVHDQDINKLQTTQVIVGGSYQKVLSDPRSIWQHKAGIGVQIGISRQVVQGDELWFTNQFDINNEVIRFDWNHGEAIIADRFASDSYFPIHSGLHYVLENQKVSLKLIASVNHLNEPQARFDGMTVALNRGYFVHLLGTLKIDDQLEWGPWFSFAGLGISKVFQAGTHFSLRSEAYQDWRMRLSAFTQLSPRISTYDLTQIGASFDIQWNEIGLSFKYLFPVNRIDHIGNTFQLGLFFIPDINKSLTY